MRWQALYEQKKRGTALEALSSIEAGVDIVLPLAVGEPRVLVEALPQHEKLAGNRLFQMLSLGPVIDVDPARLKIISMFLAGDERKAFYNKKIDLLPNHFSDLPALLQDITHQPVVLATVSKMDDDGYFSLGTNCDYVMSLVESGAKVILEVNEHMPYTYGKNHIHIEAVEAFVESTRPLPVTPEIPLRQEDEQIGKRIAALIHDGATLQIGFGAIPNAIMNDLREHKDLTIHTEMIPDKVVDLMESGAVTNVNNLLAPGTMTAAFAYGSQRLYDFMDHNESIRMMPVDETNNSCLMREMSHLFTINAAVEVDLLGQCNAETVAGSYYSSTGGQGDFGIGARMSREATGVICLHASAKQGAISKIVSRLSPGAIVTTSKNDVDIVVTEYGIAKLRGKTIRERAAALIAIAHPNFREKLTQEAREMGYLD
ncbi:acetyl-CoA hydrolase/transferase C-terminal domain-containing protein [Bacillus sp. FSL W7-1360]